MGGMNFKKQPPEVPWMGIPWRMLTVAGKKVERMLGLVLGIRG